MGVDMKITDQGPNWTEIEINSNYVLFSYKTPVAIRYRGGKIVVTDKFHSKTTSKHINRWIYGNYTKVSQSWIDSGLDRMVP